MYRKFNLTSLSLSDNIADIQMVIVTIYMKGAPMARKAKIQKNRDRQATVDRYAERRQELKANGDYAGLAKLPRDASPTRLVNRDRLDGRPRGYLGKFGLSRIRFRQLALEGKLPGVRKASW